MALTITSLRVDKRKSPEGASYGGDIPYLIVNATWKIMQDDDDESDYLLNVAKAEAEEYGKVLTIESPEDYEKWLLTWDFTFETSYPGHKNCWTHKECPWNYIEKFQTFWFREWIADGPVTRAAIDEIRHFKETGKMLSEYRTVDGQIMLEHIRTLHRYWD
jgi:hypothetical protein